MPTYKRISVSEIDMCFSSSHIVSLYMNDVVLVCTEDRYEIFGLGMFLACSRMTPCLLTTQTVVGKR